MQFGPTQQRLIITTHTRISPHCGVVALLGAAITEQQIRSTIEELEARKKRFDDSISLLPENVRKRCIEREWHGSEGNLEPAPDVRSG